MKTFGVRIQADGTVRIDKAFAWGEPVTLEQHGVRVERSTTETVVTFLDGQSNTVPAGTNQTIKPQVPIQVPSATLALPEKPPAAPPALVQIPVQVESDASPPEE